MNSFFQNFTILVPYLVDRVNHFYAYITFYLDCKMWLSKPTSINFLYCFHYNSSSVMA